MAGERDCQDLIRELLVRELETVNVYSAMVQQARTPSVRALIAGITAQEKHHIAEAVDLLARYDANQAEALAVAGLRVREPEPAAPPAAAPSEVVYEPAGARVAVAAGETLLAAGLRSGVDIRHDCGGHGKCGTCRVEVLGGAEALTEITDPERHWLGDDLGAGWRLACQTRPRGEVQLRVPENRRAKKAAAEGTGDKES